MYCLCVGPKMSACAVFLEVWLHVETDRSVGLIRAENFAPDKQYTLQYFQCS